jgi:hypothetical protein
MARQVLPIVGAVVGAYFGNPQLGYAIGAMIGNAVDPQRLKGPRLREGPAQSYGEGAYRQVVYGTSWIWETQVLEVGPIRRVTVEEQQGKGGGPIIESDRGYQTFAIGLGEPLEAIRVIRMDGKIVYDVRPTSTILAESAAFAERFRFYTGAEDQLPDPDLEALPGNGVGNTAYYRGTAYLVFPNYDVTDLAGRIPTVEVEGMKLIGDEAGAPSLVTTYAEYVGGGAQLELGNVIGWAGSPTNVAVTRSGTYAVASVYDDTGSDRFQFRKLDADTGTWSALTLPSDLPSKGPRSMAFSPDDRYLACAVGDAEPLNLVVYELDGDTLTALPYPAEDFPGSAVSVAWDSEGARLAIGANLGAYVYDFVAGLLVNQREVSASFVATSLAFVPGLGGRYLACGNPDRLYVAAVEETPVRIAAFEIGNGARGVHWDSSYSYLFVVGNQNTDSVSVWNFDGSVIGSETLTLEGLVADQPESSPRTSSITSDGRFLAISRQSSSSPVIYEASDVLPPTLERLPDPDPGAIGLLGLAWSGIEIDTINSRGVLLADLIADICDRCGIAEAKLDLAALTEELAGVTLGGQYDGAGAITTLMPAFFFDLFEADRQIHAVNRGGAVVQTITADDLIEEPDENTLRGQDIEYPRALLLKYLDPDQNYAAPAATVQRNSPDIRVRGEATAELPIAMTRTQAFRVAERMHKVMWEDLNGEVTFSLPAGPFAWLTPSDCLGLSLRGALYRIRVEKVEYAAGVLKVTARRDRQSAYTSNLTPTPLPAPTPPPPSLAGATQFVVLNIPGIVDGDDAQLGIRVGVCGLDGFAWSGCAVRVSSDGGLSWSTVANITTRARIGNLLDPLAGASPFYTDATNTIRVLMLDDRELEAITLAQLLSEQNPVAIAYPDGSAEILQFRDVVDEGDNEWSLSYLLRGRLNTASTEHAAGARFVMLNGTVFVPLPTALLGQALMLQFVSFGTSPEVAPTYSFTWSPAHSQTEWEPTDLVVTREGGNIEASWAPRHRFGTEDSPVASINFEGYRVVFTDGTTTVSSDTTATSLGMADGFSGPVTVSVAQINRITQAGPAISEVVP